MVPVEIPVEMDINNTRLTLQQLSNIQTDMQETGHTIAEHAAEALAPWLTPAYFFH